MHQELALQYIRPKNPRPFSQDREAWLTMAVIFLPLFAGFVMMLWTPMKPPRYPLTFRETDGTVGGIYPPRVSQRGSAIYPAQYAARLDSRRVAMGAGFALALAMAVWRGNKIRRLGEDDDLRTLPVNIERMNFFAVAERIRAHGLCGLISFALFAAFTSMFALDLARAQRETGYSTLAVMMSDIWGSSAHFFSWRYGQAYLFAWIVYSCVLLIRSGVTRSRGVWVAPLLLPLAWLPGAIDPRFWRGGYEVSGAIVLSAIALLFRGFIFDAIRVFSDGEPPPTIATRVKQAWRRMLGVVR